MQIELNAVSRAHISRKGKKITLYLVTEQRPSTLVLLPKIKVHRAVSSKYLLLARKKKNNSPENHLYFNSEKV